MVEAKEQKGEIRIWRDANLQYPPFFMRVLVYCNDHISMGLCASITLSSSGYHADWFDLEGGDLEPTHWMFLPDAPTIQIND